MNDMSEANKQQAQQQQQQVQQAQQQQQLQQQQEQQQQQQQQQVQMQHEGLLQQQGQSSGAPGATPQALIVNTANIAQQQQQQLQNNQQIQQLQQQMQTVPQSQGSNMQSQLGSISLNQQGQTTLTTMQAPLNQLAQSGANTLTTMQAPLGTMALQGNGQAISMQASGMPIHTPQSGTTTITTMSTLQQHGQHPIQAQTPAPQQGQIQQVQVIQQPYLQQMAYSTQSGQLLMPGNIALHPAGMNPGSIQVIAAGKPFQPNQLASHMLTPGKQVLTQGQPTSFQSYATIPTTTNQTLLISQVGLVSSQPNILPAHSAKQDMQKMKGVNVVAGSGFKTSETGALGGCVVSQGQLHSSIGQQILPIQYTTCQGGRTVQQNTPQPMQFSPWQFGTSLPQGIAWAPQPPTLLTTQNPIFIRGATQQDGSTPMFIQSPPPQTLHAQHPQGISTQGTLPNLTQIAASGNTTTSAVGAKPRNSTDNIQPKGGAPVARQLSNILPSGQPVIRPAASVSTQTAVNQHLTQAQMQNQKAQAKMRAKPMIRGQVGGQKADAANQTKPQSISPQQQQQLAATNKMILTSAGTIVASPQQMAQDQLKQQQQQQLQQKAVQQQLAGMQQQQQQINIQQQLNYQQQQQQQLIQPKPPPVIGMAVTLQQHQQLQHQQQQQQQQVVQQQAQAQQQPQQQQSQPTAIPVPVERPVMTVASMPPTPAKEDGGEEKSIELSETAPTEAVTEPQPMDQSTTNTEESASEETIVGETPPASKVDAPPEESTRERDLPKALVKPHVLTHVIEGYVIQEASEPFPTVNRSLLTELAQVARTEKEIRNQMITADEPPLKKQALEGSKSDMDKCEACGKMDIRLKLKKGKRFCSVACKRKLSKSGSPEKKSKEWVEGAEVDMNDSAAESSLSPSPHETAAALDTEDSSASDTNLPKINPLKWTVSDVCEFIRALPGCCDYAEDFAIQEIDGQALMLLKEDHLMSAMAMKLGPALKICAKIDTMRGTMPQPQPSPEK